MPDKLQVRVYKDGRACVPAPLLRKAWGSKDLPKQIFISMFHWEQRNAWLCVLAWDALTRDPKSVKYDLSIRERVLFGKFPLGQVFDVDIDPETKVITLRGVGKGQTKSSRSRKKPGRKRTAQKTVLPEKELGRKRAARKVLLSIEKEMEEKLRGVAGGVLRSRFPDATLAEVAKVAPRVTVGDILG